MSVKLSSFLLLLFASQLSGCAYLYNAGNDKTAQEAKQAFADVKLGSALEQERSALIAQQAERQALVRRSQLAMRDAWLAGVINDDRKDSWSELQTFANRRLLELAGQSVTQPGQDCNPKLDELQRALNIAQAQIEVGKVQFQLFPGVKDSKLQLSCSTQPTQLPASLNNELVQIFVGNFDALCKSVNAYAMCIKAYSSGGKLNAINLQLASILKEQSAVQTLIAEQKKAYDAARADIAQAKPEPGQAEKLSAKLTAAIDKLKDHKAADALQNDAILKHVADEATIEALHQKKQLVDDYLAALAGQEAGKGGDADNPDLQKLRLLSDVVNSVTGRPAPPVAGLMLQSEYYRLQIEGAQKRLARATEQTSLLRKQQVYLTAEMAHLQQLDSALKEAGRPCAGSSLSAAAEGNAPACKRLAASALIQFSMAWTLGRLPAEQAEYLMIDQQELAALDESETALKQTDAVYTAALEEVARRHGKGLKPEQLSNLWQALGVTAIAVRVK